MKALVGLDIGGTKAAVRVEDAEDRTVVVDTEIASPDWDAEPIAWGVSWIVRALDGALPPGAEVVALGVGAQGFDNPTLTEDYSRRLAALGYPTVAVNDAALLAPAAGLERCLGLIAGTGAIGVGWTESGRFLHAGGWGHVIGDDAGAAGLVRRATIAALRRHDDGLPDDGLLAALTGSFQVPDAERLARAVNDRPTMENWAPHAPVVFRAAAEGSATAAATIEAGAAHLATLVDQLLARGAVSDDVVVAGSVIARQPAYLELATRLITQAHPTLRVRLLDAAPVVGAVELASREQSALNGS